MKKHFFKKIYWNNKNNENLWHLNQYCLLFLHSSACWELHSWRVHPITQIFFSLQLTSGAAQYLPRTDRTSLLALRYLLLRLCSLWVQLKGGVSLLSLPPFIRRRLYLQQSAKNTGNTGAPNAWEKEAEKTWRYCSYPVKYIAYKATVSLRKNCVTVTTPTSRALYQRFFPVGEAGFNIESSKCLSKGTDFICHTMWKNWRLKTP